MPPVVGKAGEYVLRIKAFRGFPVMGLKLYSMGVPTMGKLVGKSP